MSTGLVFGEPVTQWVAKRLKANCFAPDSQAIGWLRDDEIIAGVVYEQWNGANVVCHIASDRSRKWLTRQYLWTIFDYPFRQLKARRITVTVADTNNASRRFVEHLGFTLEATLEQAHPAGDYIVYRMFEKDCRWLRENLYRMRLPLAA